MTRASHRIGNARINLGWDRAVGYFVEVRRSGQAPAFYDALQPGYVTDRPLWGAFEFLITAGVAVRDDIERVLLAQADGERLPRRLRDLAAVLNDLRTSGDRPT